MGQPIGFLEDFVKTAGNGRQTLQTIEVAIRPDQFLYAYLKNGATVDMSVDGSGPSVVYKYTVPAGKMLLLNRVLIHIQDGRVDPGDFGGISALSNGLGIDIFDSSDASIEDFTAGEKIKSNTQWSMLAGVDINFHYAAAAVDDDSMTMRWTLGETGAMLSVHAGEYLAFTINDNLAGLTNFEAILHGILLHAE